jgi:DNA invertase Pin-like site-specific DNA recombinase
MSSDREALVEALEAIEAGCTAVGVFPLETLSRTDGQALLARLDKLDQKLVALQRSLNGRLIMTARQVSA